MHKEKFTPCFTIYSEDLIPVVFKALDSEAQEIVDVSTFTNIDVARQVLMTIPVEKRSIHGRLDIREVLEA